MQCFSGATYHMFVYNMTCAGSCEYDCMRVNTITCGYTVLESDFTYQQIKEEQN